MTSLLREFISSILLEGKVDDIKKKWTKEMTAKPFQWPASDVSSVIDHLSERDPSSTKRYLEWMAKQMFEYIKFEENKHSWSGDLMDQWWSVVKQFDKVRDRMDKRDINAYKSVDELKAAVEAVPTQSKTKQKKEARTKGSEKIYEDDNHLLIYIFSKDAAVNYGAGTQWCITSVNQRHYEDYHNKGVKFYFLFQKNMDDSNPLYKVAFAVTPNGNVEAYDAVDDLVENISSLVRFESMAIRDVKSRPENEKIKTRSEYHDQLVNPDYMDGPIEWLDKWAHLDEDQKMAVLDDIDTTETNWLLDEALFSVVTALFTVTSIRKKALTKISPKFRTRNVQQAYKVVKLLESEGGMLYLKALEHVHPAHLFVFVESEDKSLRLYAAKHGNDDVAGAFTDDPDELVRTTARRRLGEDI